MRRLLAFSVAALLSASAFAQPAALPAVEQGAALHYPARPSGTLAGGERYDPERLTVAHASLPFGTLVELTSVSSGRAVTARVNDRDTGGALVRVSARTATHLGLPASGGEVVLRLDPSEIAYLRAHVPPPAQANAPVEQFRRAAPVDAARRPVPVRYAVQVGVFTDALRAGRRAEELPGAWVLADGEAHRVLVGGFADLGSAVASREGLRAQGIDGFVRVLDSEREVPAPVAAPAHASMAASPTGFRLLRPVATAVPPTDRPARGW